MRGWYTREDKHPVEYGSGSRDGKDLGIGWWISC